MSARRVLHVVRSMANAGVETWLMHVLRRIDKQRVSMDFLVHTGQECAYDAEIEEHGCRILRCCERAGSPRYASQIRKLIRVNGPYHAVHSHLHHFSGYVLRLARMGRVPARIAHSHSDTSLIDESSGWIRQGYLQLMKSWIRDHATAMVAASTPAGECLFGRNWKQDARGRVLHCGIDLETFPRGTSRDAARARIRAAWNIPADAFVIGHVGRFDTPKNHDFLMDFAAEAMLRDPSAVLVLVGNGRLQNTIRERTIQMSLDSRVVFAGVREDVSELLAAMDVFVFPSKYEGLGLALVEAQAAGLPCVISDAIPREADLVTELVQRLSLRESAAAWAGAVARARTRKRPDPEESLRLVRETSLNIERSVEQLYVLYDA
jgi:glycosyltransferase involved in cell wall biosynthesis